jgi:heme exporter protein D
VEAPPGEHQVRLAFVMPVENRVGWVLAGISLLALAALAAQGVRERKP